MNQHILLCESPDQPGLVAHITNTCFKHRLNIIKNSEFVDPQSKAFFMRSVLQQDEQFNGDEFLQDLHSSLPDTATCRLAPKQRKRVVLLATKEAHCLGDILIKHYNNALDIEIAAVVSNHDLLRSLVDKFEIPFHFVSHEGLTRNQHEEKILKILANYQPDFLVLAKYMRILSEEFVVNYPYRIINIHHSFLPAFIGANPYKQAFDRGVKMIGATAHYVNQDLDQGPIIHQDVIHVDHSYQPDKLARTGQQLEESVLLEALQLVIREKVFVFGNRTVVFK